MGASSRCRPLDFWVVSMQVVSIDCSPTDAYRAVSCGTDRCIKVTLLMTSTARQLSIVLSVQQLCHGLPLIKHPDVIEPAWHAMRLKDLLAIGRLGCGMIVPCARASWNEIPCPCCMLVRILRHCCLQVWDLSRGFQVNTFLQPSSVNAVRLTMDGTMAVSGHFDGTLRFWDLRSAKLANEVTGLHTQQITSVSIGIRSGMPDALAHLEGRDVDILPRRCMFFWPEHCRRAAGMALTCFKDTLHGLNKGSSAHSNVASCAVECATHSCSFLQGRC